MYPTISDLLNDLFGFYIPLPVQTFGFFVVLSILSIAYFTGLDLKRKENEGLIHSFKKQVTKGLPATKIQLLIAVIAGFLIGYKLLDVVLNYSDFVGDPQGFIISLKGNFWGGVIGAILSAYSKYKEKDKEKLDKPEEVEEVIHPHQLIGNLTIIVAITGFLGAKIFHNLENIDELMADPIEALLSFSGYTFYGGMICGTIAALYYMNRYKISSLHTLDAGAPGLMLAYGVGRIGCQLSGDGDWGIDNLAPKPGWMSFLPDWFWSFNYPHNVINDGILIPGCEGNHCYMLENSVFPTPLYESMICIFLFIVLWKIRKKITVPGALFCVFMIMNGIERFMIEKIRINPVYHIFGSEITQAEIISFLMVLLGILGIYYFSKQKIKISTA